MAGLSKETLAAFAELEDLCQMEGCWEEATAVIYDRLQDSVRPANAPIALTFACDKHVRNVRWLARAEWDDIDYLPNHMPS